MATIPLSVDISEVSGLSAALDALSPLKPSGGDDTAAIQAALNASIDVSGGGATFKTSATLYIPDGVTFRDAVIDATVIGPAISNYLGPWTSHKYGQHLNSVKVAGTCDYGVIWVGGVLGGMRGVTISAACTHGFIVDGSFGNKFEQLSTAGAQISGACFWAGADFNANHLDGLYTSNFSAYNFLSARDANAITGYVSAGPAGQGSTLTNICCQGGAVGMALHDVGAGWTINSPYFENCVTPIRLGNGDGHPCRSVTINSPFLLAPASGSTVAIDIDLAYNVTFNSPEFGDWGVATDLIRYRSAHNVQVNGFYLSAGGPGAKITDKIKRKPGAETDGGVFVIGEETSTNGSRNHFLLMKCTGYGAQHYKMELNGLGAWLASSVVPASV